MNSAPRTPTIIEPALKKSVLSSAYKGTSVSTFYGGGDDGGFESVDGTGVGSESVVGVGTGIGLTTICPVGDSIDFGPD